MTREAAKLIGRPVGEMKIVSLMLGSGCTANAMLHGRSVDVSTGFTPHEGLIQSTRAGDIDATAVTYLMDKEGLSTRAMEDILNRESGWLGISGISNDMREIGAQANANPRARLAIDAAAYRCRKYVGVRGRGGREQPAAAAQDMREYGVFRDRAGSGGQRRVERAGYYIEVRLARQGRGHKHRRGNRDSAGHLPRGYGRAITERMMTACKWMISYKG